jgi:hypothetical protein
MTYHEETLTMTSTKHVALVVAIAGLALSSPASAQVLGPTATTGPIPVIGSVPTFCTGGTVSGTDGVFNVGVLVDQTTGFLRTDLAAPPKTVAGAFCNAASSITIGATRMIPTSFAGLAPTGFTTGVDYIATATGWTTTDATTSTSQATNPGAVQQRPTPGGSNILVAVSGFSATGGNTLRPVADPLYRGQVVLTLAVVN